MGKNAITKVSKDEISKKPVKKTSAKKTVDKTVSKPDYNNKNMLIENINIIDLLKIKEDIKTIQNTINELIDAIQENNADITLHINDINNRLINLESNTPNNTSNNIGSTLERPSANEVYVGFKYYDTNLNKEIIVSEIVDNNVCWRENDGAIAGVKRIGSTLERPKGNEIYVGFKYYDTTINRLLIAIKINGNNIIWMNVQ